MKKPTTITSESVSEYREFIELRLRKRVPEAIEVVIDEELDQALGCRAYERSEERCASCPKTQTIAACWSRWSQPAMATTNKIQGWLCLLMTEDSSFHWPTKPQTSLIRNVPARQS